MSLERGLLPALAMLAACTSTAGREFDSTHVTSIKVGTTRRAEIDSWFGIPYQRSVMAPTDKGGVRRYVYAFARKGSAAADVVGKSLIVDFDGGEIVVDMRYTEQGVLPPAVKSP